MKGRESCGQRNYEDFDMRLLEDLDALELSSKVRDTGFGTLGRRSCQRCVAAGFLRSGSWNWGGSVFLSSTCS